MAESSPRTAPLTQRSNPKLGIWIFISGEVVFFGTLILTYLMIRLRAPADFAQAKTHLSVPIIAVNTFILILSSFMVVQSLESIRDGKTRAFRNYLIAVMVLGAMFLGGQAFEWTSLYHEGIWFTSTFGTPFFTITGIHGTHVFIGLIWASFLQWGIHKKAYTQSKHLAIENFGLYWHFVDIVWIVLFTLFYLI